MKSERVIAKSIEAGDMVSKYIDTEVKFVSGVIKSEGQIIVLFADGTYQRWNLNAFVYLWK